MSATEAKIADEQDGDTPMTEDTDVDMKDKQTVEMTPEQRESNAVRLKQEGNQKYAAGELRQAIKLYSNAIDLVPDNHPEFYCNRAAAYIGLRNYGSALSDCMRAAELNETYLKAFVRGVECLIHLGKLEEAVELVERGKTNCGDSDRRGDFENFLGRIDNCRRRRDRARERMSEGNFSSALNIIRSLLESDMSASLELRLMEIECVLEEGNAQEALSMSTNLARMYPDDYAPLKLRSIALFRTQNVDSAIRHVQRILSSDPDNMELKRLFKMFKNSQRMKTAGNDAFKAGNMELAFAKYSACLELDPKNVVYNGLLFCNRALVSLKMNDYDAAYNDCCRAIDCDASNVKAYVRRSDALIGLERFEEAVQDCEKAQELDPRNRDVLTKLKQAKLELKKSLRKDYYKILGVEKDASEKDLKKAFRKGALKWHPDRFATASEEEQKQAEEHFKEIGEAYEVLNDPEMRRKYDMGYDLNEIKQGAAGMGGHGFHGADVADILRMFNGMGGGPGMGGMGGHPGGMPGGFTFRFG